VDARVERIDLLARAGCLRRGRLSRRTRALRRGAGRIGGPLRVLGRAHRAIGGALRAGGIGLALLPFNESLIRTGLRALDRTGRGATAQRQRTGHHDHRQCPEMCLHGSVSFMIVSELSRSVARMTPERLCPR
jgi:hypothetical protein